MTAEVLHIVYPPEQKGLCWWCGIRKVSRGFSDGQFGHLLCSGCHDRATRSGAPRWILRVDRRRRVEPEAWPA